MRNNDELNESLQSQSNIKESTKLAVLSSILQTLSDAVDVLSNLALLEEESQKVDVQKNNSVQLQQMQQQMQQLSIQLTRIERKMR